MQGMCKPRSAVVALLLVGLAAMGVVLALAGMVDTVAGLGVSAGIHHAALILLLVVPLLVLGWWMVFTTESPARLISVDLASALPHWPSGWLSASLLILSPPPRSRLAV